MKAPGVPSQSNRTGIAGNRLPGSRRLLAGFRLSYAAAMAGEVTAAALNAATFLLLRYMVDDVLVRPDPLGLLYFVVLGLIGLATLRGAFSFLGAWLSARVAEGVALRLRNRLFDHVQRLPLARHDHLPGGDLLQRLTADIDALRRFYAQEAVGLGRMLLQVGIGAAAMFGLNASLAWDSLTLVPLIAAISVVFFFWISRVYGDIRRCEAEMTHVLQENVTGMRTVRAFAGRSREMDRFARENRERYRIGRWLAILRALYASSLILCCFAQALVTYSHGARLAISGAITAGTYVAIAGLVWQINWPLTGLGWLVVQASTARASRRRVVRLARMDRETVGGDGPPGDVRGEIAFQNVSLAHDAGRPVLHDVSFRCRAGQTVALLGPSGSGKSSLVSLLLRFYDYEGSITLDGIDLGEYPRRYLSGQIGLVEQEPFLFARSIRENIACGVKRDVADGEIEAAARAAAVHDTIHSFPRGYDTLVGENGVTLSGGQRQRIAIARVLLKDPRILILDDVTSSMDAETGKAVWAALRRLAWGRTTFIVTPHVRQARDADLILVLDGGRIVQQGTHDKLVAQPGLYRRLCGALPRQNAVM